MTLTLAGVRFAARRRQTSWSDAEIEQLRQLWAAGKTASEIAALIPGKTRNAIIGRVHRDRHAPRPSPIAGRVTKPREPTPEKLARPARVQTRPLKPSEIKAPRLTVDGRIWRSGSAPSVTPAPKLLPPEVSILGPGTCQWIEGDPQIDPTKCGARALLGKAWCPDHHTRCYKPRIEPEAA
jgi:hypothetical protein